jgi:hypothetical protein
MPSGLQASSRCTPLRRGQIFLERSASIRPHALNDKTAPAGRPRQNPSDRLPSSQFGWTSPRKRQAVQTKRGSRPDSRTSSAQRSPLISTGGVKPLRLVVKQCRPQHIREGRVLLPLHCGQLNFFASLSLGIIDHDLKHRKTLL